MFTPDDLQQINRHGQTLSGVEKQLSYFRAGFPYLNLLRAATREDGIKPLKTSELDLYRGLYQKHRSGIRVVKFVPASGAATRMFKALFEFLNNETADVAVQELVSQIEKFAFWGSLESCLDGSRDAVRIVRGIVDDCLHYGTLPKGMILFHRYAEECRTAFEEHLCEGALYASGAGSEVHIHFTVSPEHRAAFEQVANEVMSRYESRYGVIYRLSYSYQKPSTDTLAVNPDNTPFRDAEGQLLFRPAGHGALIENLNEVDADLIFIKTIDNVAPDRLKADTVAYKEALGGLLLDLQSRCFEYLKQLQKGDLTAVEQMSDFVSGSLSHKLPEGFIDWDMARRGQLLRELLDRPIRVCGMVRNEGEPGGGPFWVSDPDGGESLQIAESSQISPSQKHLMTEATHFNPVDLVCGVRNYRGEKYDLSRYVDPQTGFISSKSQQGRPLKALELPGLWNGAMSQWNTVFVEVPITTFSPVKVVNDLLRAQHQA